MPFSTLLRVDPRFPEMVPADPEGRREYVRYWLPRLSPKREREWRARLSTDPANLSNDAVDSLLSQFVKHEIGREPDKRLRGRGLEDWTRAVLNIAVELRAGGRAVLRASHESFHVEIHWAQRRDHGERRYHPKRVEIVSDRGWLEHPDLDAYFTAFGLAITGGRAEGSEKAFLRAPSARPEPGKPLDLGFYRDLITAFDALVAEGRKDPAVELARRMDMKHATVKSWLSRGRTYLSEAGGS